MTYAQTIGAAEIDWEEVFKNKDADKEAELRDWATCPCGQLPSTILRDGKAVPDDPVLNKVGSSIHNAYIDRDFDACLALHQALKQRTKYLSNKHVRDTEEEITQLQERLVNLREKQAISKAFVEKH